MIIRVCPQTNKNMRVFKENYIGKLSEELLWKVVQQFTSEDVQWTVSESCPTIHLGGLSNVFVRRVVQKNFIGNRIMCFQEQKPFVLKTMFFSHLAFACVRESERARDVGKGESHSHP